MILAIPPERRVSNDNNRTRFWVCAKCDNGCFLLIHDQPTGSTTIECAQCRTDVTDQILPHLPIVAVDLKGA